MIQLPNVTLIAVATRNHEASFQALLASMKGINFGSVILVSDKLFQDLIPTHLIEPFPTIDDWNRYMVYDLYKHFDTEFCLLVHADGFVVNPQSWRDEFLNYSYIGSPWSHQCAVAIQGGRDQPYSRVGNSVGIRSHKLCKLPSEIDMEWKRFNADSNEDTFISCHNRTIFEQHGCTFAPFELAVQFGREEPLPEHEGVDPFVFHKWQGLNAQYPRF